MNINFAREYFVLLHITTYITHTDSTKRLKARITISTTAAAAAAKSAILTVKYAIALILHFEKTKYSAR